MARKGKVGSGSGKKHKKGRQGSSADGAAVSSRASPEPATERRSLRVAASAALLGVGAVAGAVVSRVLGRGR